MTWAVVGYSQSMPFASDLFHVVVVSEVLEHLSDDVLEESQGQIHRVLAPGGFVLGTVPARENLEEQIVCDLVGCKLEGKAGAGRQDGALAPGDSRLRGVGLL